MTRQTTATAQLRTHILNVLSEHPQRSLTFKQLLQALGLHGGEIDILARVLREMQQEGLVIKTGAARYGLPRRLDCLTGVLQGNRRGFAFLLAEGQGEDVFIKPGNLKDAVHGDRVVIRLTARSKRRREGEVIGIIQRGASRLVGTLEQHGKRDYVIPDDRRFFQAIQVERGGPQKARRGDKVVVEIRSWARGNLPPLGRVVERLGPAGSNKAEQLSLHRKFDLPGDFPSAVLKEVEALPPGEAAVSRAAAAEERRDLGRLPMVTIDDEQARDFDDAVSLEMLEEGSFRLGVHIADVSHYVRDGKPLDREAHSRSTSTYLVDRVIHMLPPVLSEDLCSLKAGEERLAVSVFMDLTPDGDLAGYRFYPSLIRVTERLTYRQVESFLEGKTGGKPLENASLGGMLGSMDQLASLLRRRRLQRGTLDLDLPEARIILDEAGNPVALERRSMGRAESLIEEFMILCNEVVASHFDREKLPCLYRVHAVPTAEKLAALREILAAIGFDAVSGLKELKPGDLQMLLERSRGERAEKLVRYMMLRSLPQARYSAVNEGHFGLASRCYCHFTSPIRRYPDLVVHRILKESLSAGSLKPARIGRLQSRLTAVAQHASERERAAMEAERASEDIKKAHYMEDKIGEVYPGIISGVTNFGIFVELENTVEGMIPVSELTDDYYVYREKLAALVGERTRKTFRLGDPLQVQVVSVNRAEGNITFALDQGT